MTDIYKLINADNQLFQDNIIKTLSDSYYFGLAQINPIAGDLEFNSKKIIKYIQNGIKLGLKALIFPEFALIGTNMIQTTEKFPFLLNETEKYIKVIATYTRNCTVLVGYINSRFKSCIAVLENGNIIKEIEQNDLCNITISGVDCEIFVGDKYENVDVKKHLDESTKIFINCSAQQVGNLNEEKKSDFLSIIAKTLKIPTINVNIVGNTDSFSYNGTSRMYDLNGNLVACAKSFEEQLLLVNPIKNYGKIYFNPALKQNKFTLKYTDLELEELYKNLIQGVKDYFTKCNLKKAVIGLSGGLDSTVCAVLLADAIGEKNVFGISMPSKITSNESKTDAFELAKNLGINYAEASIEQIFNTTSNSFETLFKNIEKYWNDRYPKSFTPDNIQARARATYLWGIANEFPSCIPIATSDKSEAYMGYATINGDMSGGLAPIADVTKTKLFALAKWMNNNRKKKNTIPETIILKRPGAELAIDPNTGKTLMAEDALMPYDFMDEIIWRIEKNKESFSDMVNSEFIYEKHHNISKDKKLEWLEKFFRRMSFAIFKGNILPPSIITDYPTNLKSGYYQPITSKINYKEVHSEDILKTILN